MSTELHRPVVVGIDGSDDSERALRFAIEEATRRGVGIRVVTAAYDKAPLPPMQPLLTSETLRQAGSRIAADAARLVTELTDGELPVEAVVDQAAPRPVVLKAAEDATAIVLGPRAMGPLARVVSSSTTTGVAARATCPVFCVPVGWRPNARRDRVLVGVDGSAASREVLAAAFDEASRRGASLTVLHAWRLDNQYDAFIASRTLADQWQERAKVKIAELLAGWQKDYPEVKVEMVLEYERPAVALVDRSDEVDLVVVGRHGHGRFGLPLGSNSRALIHSSHAPVKIIPHRAEDGSV